MGIIRVGLLYWEPDDGIADAIKHELLALGYRVIPFQQDDPVPADADVIFTFAPYGPWLPIAREVATARAGGQTPILVHWNTEGMPDLRLPRSLMYSLGRLRSKYDLWLSDVMVRDSQSQAGRLASLPHRRFHRFRFLGDYLSAYKNGWLHVFADISAIYAQMLEEFGLPTLVAPYGSVPAWYEDLELDRDVDVLWMGKYASSRRRRILGTVRERLKATGVQVYMADNEENPFVHGPERTKLLNRTKIVVNVTRTWYDDNTLRLGIAAPNRAMVVSEHMLDHCPPLRAGEHYAACEPEQLADTILYYLQHDKERETIADNAYRLFTEELTFRNSIAKIMAEAMRALESGNVASLA